MKKVYIILIALIIFHNANAQDTIKVSMDSITDIKFNTTNQSREAISGYPYKTSFKKDAPVIVLGFGLTYWGNTLIKNKKPLTLSELATKTKDKIPFFDKIC